MEFNVVVMTANSPRVSLSKNENRLRQAPLITAGAVSAGIGREFAGFDPAGVEKQAGPTQGENRRVAGEHK